MKHKSLGLPYMGSKRKLAPKIVDYILEHNPKCKYVYDLFGGGGSISFEFLQRKQTKKVVYNELNTGVCELLRDIRDNGITEKYYQHVDRETFNAYKKDDNWFGGLCKVVWSFGNNQKGYLFRKDVEEYKMWYHEVVVFGIDRTKEMSEFCKNYVFEKHGIEQDLILEMPVKQDYQERRLEIRKQLVEFEKKCKVNQLREIQQLQQLEQLQQLQRLQQLEQLQQLEIHNKSFEEIIIDTPIDETIIYLDPPYKDTGGYQKKVCHDFLDEYIKKSPYKIYLSSYESDFKEVACFEHRTTMAMGRENKNNKTLEKLFCNREEGRDE
jgi:site-specific DNA-adenine methylase